MRQPQTPASPSPASFSSHFWAYWDFDKAAPSIIRKDTRLYWMPQISGTVGRCVGTFWGENPGGAKSLGPPKVSGYWPSKGDRTLNLILDTWKTAFCSHGTEPHSDDYIEILNLYYFCDGRSGNSLQLWRDAGAAKLYEQAPATTSGFILLGWGAKDKIKSEACRAVSLIKMMTYVQVILPTSSGHVKVIANASLIDPVVPPPAQPSYFCNDSLRLRPLYVKNVAEQLRAVVRAI
jgi:hypothetical protein